MLANNDFGSRNFTFTNSLLHKRFRVGKKIPRLRYVLVHNFLRRQCFTEVEMVNSVDDLKSSCSIQGITHFRDFELLDARIASALNKIIHNSCFKNNVSLEEQQAQKADRFLRGRQIACLTYDHFRVTASTILYLIMPTYSRLFFRMTIFRVRYEMDDNFLSREQFPPDDILESLHKSRTRESEKLKNLENH